MADASDLPQLRARQSELVTALATETNPGRLAELQRELEQIARQIERDRLER